jgi:hypothetical protein
MQLVHDYSPAELRNNVIGLAKLGKVFKLPTVLTTSSDQGPNGPIIPELLSMFSGAPLIRRTTGTISAWDYPEFVAAIEKTDHKNLIMAGVTIDVCLAFAAMQAVDAGYNVYGVVDASGALDATTRELAIARMKDHGITPINWTTVAAELQRDWSLPTGQDLGLVFHDHYHSYGLLIDKFRVQDREGGAEGVLAASHTVSDDRLSPISLSRSGSATTAMNAITSRLTHRPLSLSVCKRDSPLRKSSHSATNTETNPCALNAHDKDGVIRCEKVRRPAATSESQTSVLRLLLVVALLLPAAFGQANNSYQTTRVNSGVRCIYRLIEARRIGVF